MTTDELRAKFEATISSIDPKTFRQCFSLETDSNGYYKDEAISGLWNGFLLGRASRDAEVEALRKDAERYRWLRAATNRDWTVGKDSEKGGVYQYYGQDVDAAIEAAMREGK